jgi:hypothetical protein
MSFGNCIIFSGRNIDRHGEKNSVYFFNWEWGGGGLRRLGNITPRSFFGNDILIARNEHTVFENRLQKRIFGSRAEWKKTA